MKNSIIILIVYMLLITDTHTQTLDRYYPLGDSYWGDNYSNDDFSSAYGPRNYGPDNYDFHAAIDIKANQGTNVYSIFDGTYVGTYSPGGEFENIIIKHTENGENFMTRYYHVNDKSNLQNITGGTTIIAEIRDFGATGDTDDHLDVRYCYSGSVLSDWGTLHQYADNAGIVIGLEDDYNNDPWMVDGAGNTITPLGSYTINTLPETDPNYDYDGRYFVVGIRVDDDELDLDYINIKLFGQANDGSTYNEEDLLRETTDTDGIQNEVNYPLRINCGDQDIKDDDHGHNSNSVGIYPRGFNRTDPYHTVFFHWYINETNWENLASDVQLEVEFSDWYRALNDLAPLVYNNLFIAATTSSSDITFIPSSGTYEATGNSFVFDMTTELSGEIWFNTGEILSEVHDVDDDHASYYYQTFNDWGWRSCWPGRTKWIKARVYQSNGTWSEQSIAHYTIGGNPCSISITQNGAMKNEK